MDQQAQTVSLPPVPPKKSFWLSLWVWWIGINGLVLLLPTILKLVLSIFYINFDINNYDYSFFGSILRSLEMLAPVGLLSLESIPAFFVTVCVAGMIVFFVNRLLAKLQISPSIRIFLNILSLILIKTILSPLAFILYALTPR